MAADDDQTATIKVFAPTSSNHPIIGIQTPQTRAINVGAIYKDATGERFVPCRLHMGQPREEHTFEATVQSLKIPQIQTLVGSFAPERISTVSILRETIACRLPMALYKAGFRTHHGDAYIGANHIKDGKTIITSYTYENLEGLAPEGFWLLADSIAEGRNLLTTLGSLLAQFKPQHILIICPIGNRLGINNVSAKIASFGVDATFVVWGALFGLEPTMHYDEPWGLPDCEPIDKRDQKTFIDMYSPTLCVGGDFGNDYFCPPSARKLYEDQLRDQKITPKIPTMTEILKIYKRSELAVVDEPI